MMTVSVDQSIAIVKAEALSEPPCTAIRFLGQGSEAVTVVVVVVVVELEVALVPGRDCMMMMEM